MISNSYLILVLTESFNSIDLILNSFKIGLDQKISNSSVKASIPVYAILKRDSSFLENIALTSQSDYLALFYDHELFYIDAQSGTILFSKNFDSIDSNNLSIEYFLSPTFLKSNRLTNLTSISNTNNLIAINNLNDLVVIIYESKNLSLISSGKDSIKFESFELDQSSNAFICFDKTFSRLISFDLNSVLKMKSFNKSAILFTINLDKDSLILYTISSDLIFIVENKKN